MKYISTILIAFLLVFSTELAAQSSLELQFATDLQCETSTYCATLQVRIGEMGQTANLGSSSILFHYNEDALAFQSYNSLHFNGSDNCILDILTAWDLHGTDGASAGVFSLTMNLNAFLEEATPQYSCPTIGNDWVDIGEICFEITNNTLTSNLAFSDNPNLVSFNNYHPNDGTNSIAEGTFYNNDESLSCGMDNPCLGVVTSVFDTTSIAICSGDVVNLQGIVGTANGVDVTWTDEFGMTFENPIQVFTMACDGELRGYNAQYNTEDENGCMISNHKHLRVSIYPEIQANFEVSEDDCTIAILSCPDMVVSWESDGQSGTGNVFTPEAGTSGTVTFTIDNVVASPNCQDGVFQYEYNCTAPLPTCINDTLTECVGIGSELVLCPTFCQLEDGSILELIQAESNASLVQLGDDCFRYTPNPNFNGTDLIEVTACNMAGSVCDIAYYWIEVPGDCVIESASLPTSTEMLAVNDVFSLNMGITTIIDVLLNDEGIDNGAVHICDVTQPTSGVTLMNSDGTVYYLPNSSFEGQASFTYTLCDGLGNESEATVSLTIGAGNSSCGNFGTCTQLMTLVELCVDFCATNLAITETNTLFNCSIGILNDTCFTYHPLPGLVGFDEITVTACDGNGVCEVVEILVEVTEECEEIGAKLAVQELKNQVCDLQIANVFTPNNDGVNDLFQINQLHTCYNGYDLELFIFNRLGQVIHSVKETVHSDFSWDGSTAKKALGEGVYYYYLQLSQDNDLVKKGGFIELRY